jgi:hypothetical protein
MGSAIFPYPIYMPVKKSGKMSMKGNKYIPNVRFCTLVSEMEH